MSKIKDFEVCIFEKRRSWYELLLAAVFFSVAFYVFYLLIYFICLYELSLILIIRKLTAFVIIGGYCIPKGLQFSATKNILIDTDTNTIVARYVVGSFSYDVKSKATEFEYVSFFKDKFDCYGTNLWYVKNRHYKMYSFEDKDAAFKFALEIANKLNIDLLDATERGNSKWLEKENLK